MKIENRKIGLTLFLILFCISCAGPEITITQDTVYEEPIVEVDTEYYIGPGDVVEIIYQFESQPSVKEYILAVGDVIDVEFYYHPEMNKQVTIRPDGKITLRLKGEINAAGLTPVELQRKLARFYSDDFKDPLVTVTLIEYNQAINQLKEAVVTNNQGQTRMVKVRPDGYISFPLLEDIRTSGLTLPQLKANVSEKYKKIFENLNVSLNLQETKSNLVYVMGEVQKPDYYLLDGPATLTQILARAGGFLDSAEIESVLILSRDNEGYPVGRLVDLNSIIASANIGNDILLRQFDVVFVPKTKIAKAGVFVEQYINSIVPKFFRIGATWRLYDDD
jgi:polysaccharide export outer membrane protein